MSDQVIYLLRHARAEDRSVLRPDVDRCLVEKGRQQALKVGQFLRRHQLIPELVLTSPYPRALQTAVLVAASAELQCPLQEVVWLAHGQPAETLLQQLTTQQTKWPASTLLVGHEPELSQLLAALLHSDAQCFRIKKASLLCLHYSAAGGYQLQWCLPVQLLR